MARSIIDYMASADMVGKSLEATGSKGLSTTTQAKEYLASSNVGHNNNSGFDRQATYNGEKNLGVLEFCQNATSGIFWRIDYDGTPSKHTGETTFGDGTVLADRTLVQYKSSGEANFSYWYQGNLIEVTTTKSYQLPTDASVYVYYDINGDMSIAGQSGRTMIIQETLIAFITDDTTFKLTYSDSYPYFADERHGILMDSQTHLRLHMVDKFSVVIHGEISGIANNNGTFSSVSGGTCGDEDIQKNIDLITSAPKMFKLAGNWGITNYDDDLALLDSSTTQVNTITSGDGALVDLTGNDRLGMVMVACNDSINPIRIMVGQTAYSDRGEARDHVPAEWHRIEKEGLPSPEMTPYFTFIIDPNGNIETGADGEIYIMNNNKEIIPMFS